MLLSSHRYLNQNPLVSDLRPLCCLLGFATHLRLTHVRTAPFYPQSNGKVERWHKTLKTECIRPRTPLDLDDAKRSVAEFVRHFNEVRLHGAIGYVTTSDILAGRAEQIHADRDRKLAEARVRRAAIRRAETGNDSAPTTLSQSTARPSHSPGQELSISG
jgi:putative transposase